MAFSASKTDPWDAILLEQRKIMQGVECRARSFKLTVINREQALRLYDEESRFIRPHRPWPVLVTAREKVEAQEVPSGLQ